MKKYLVLVLILLPVLPLVAGGGIEGVTADIDVNRNVDKQDDFKAASTDIELRGGPILRPFERWPEKDLRPYAIIGIERDRDPDSISGAIPDERNQLYFGLGAGAFYNVHRNHVNIGAGPRLETTLDLKPTGASAIAYDSYYDLAVSLDLVVNMEIQLKKCWWFYAGVDVAGIDFTNERYELGGVKTVNRNFSFDSDVVGFNPRLGFTYRFQQE